METASHDVGVRLDLSKLIARDLDGRKPLCDACKTLDIFYKSEIARLQGGQQILDTSAHAAFHDLQVLNKSASSCCCCSVVLEELLRIHQRTGPIQNHAAGADKDTEIDIDFIISFRSPDRRVNVRNRRRAVSSFGIATAPCEYQGITRCHQTFDNTLFDNDQTLHAHKSPPEEVWVVQPDPKSDASINMILKWLQACEGHSKCIRPTYQSLPDRYLDVGTKASPHMRLCESSDLDCGRYIALSYVWGGYRGYVLKTTNHSAFKIQMLEREMPQTYRDLIYIARKIDVRFIWIDALCIIQDSVEDWERQSAKMAEVYGNAYVTICASKASTATQGFMGRRDPSYVYCGEGNLSDQRCAAYLFKSPHPLINHSYFAREPIASRGWCVQERLLSPRKLHFCSQQMLWECKSGMCSESKDQYEPSTKSFAFFGEQNVQGRWSEIVSDYAACSLTNNSDRLPALSGIASAYAAVTGDTYIAGHWAAQLPLSLLWHRGTSEIHRIETYQAPSWAWPSTAGRILFFVVDQQEVAQVVHVGSRITGQNPFGNIENAWLKISGPLIAVQCSAFKDVSLDLQGYMFDSFDLELLFEHATCTVKGSIALDEAINAPAVSMLIIARDVTHERTSGSDLHRYHGVLLIPSDKQADAFVRIGMGVFDCNKEWSQRFSEHRLVSLT